jgi:type II secretory pathway pseudopilin PulG
MNPGPDFVLRMRRSRLAAAERGYTVIDILMVVALAGVVGAVALPTAGSAMSGQRFNGAAQQVTNLVGLAKMRASATFSRARVRVDLGNRTYVLERWDRDVNQWTPEGLPEQLPVGVAFGFGLLGTPPPNTQAVIGLSPACRVGIDAASAGIANSACIIFNSRGLPVDSAGALFGGHGLYLTDGTRVAATTVTATPRIRRWLTRASQASWSEQQ